MKKNSLLEGTLVAYIIIITTKVLGAVYVIPFYKIIGTSGGVLYSYAYNVYNLFLNLSTSGIPTAVSIIVAEYSAMKLYNDKEKTIKIAYRFIGIVSTIAFLLMFVFAADIGKFFVGDIEGGTSIESIKLVVRTLSFCLLVIPYLSVTRGYLQGNRYVANSSLSQLIEQVVRVAVALVGAYVALNILNTPVPVGVAVALTGTVLGGTAALLYLQVKIHRNREEISEGFTSIDDATDSSKTIVKKIVTYAIPVIVVALAQNIYEMTDLKLLVKGLYIVGFGAEKSELLGSVVITWAPKITVLLTALALSLCSSIVPFVVNSYVDKDFQGLNRNFNTAINTILLVEIPLAAVIIAFNKDVYYIFYGESPYGGLVTAVMAIVCIFFSLQLVINMMLQGMKRYKIVYVNEFTGIIVNICLDIPIIILLDKIGLPPYIGSMLATITGVSTSLTIVMVSLKREFHFDYGPIVRALVASIVGTIVISVFMAGYQYLIPDANRWITKVIRFGVAGVLASVIYFALAYKSGALGRFMGQEKLDSIMRKLHLKG